MTDDKRKTRDSGHLSAMASPSLGEAGETGQWRTQRPVVDHEKCILSKSDSARCFRCWIFCPEAVIEKKAPIEIDLRYCKGCGICAAECPTSAITMEPEADSEDPQGS